MYNKLFPVIAWVAVFLLPSGILAWSDDPPSAQESKAATGTIYVLQKDTKQFVIRTTEGKDVILGVDNRTTMKLLDESINWSDLKEGMTVSVTYAYAPQAAQLIVSSVLADKRDAAQLDKSKESTTDLEPIVVKGRIDSVKSDLSEMTIKTFSDKLITIQIDNDWRNRLKNGQNKLPSLEKGSEVAAIYILRNGKNQLVVLRDIIDATEPPSAAQQPPVVTNNKIMINNQQNNRNQAMVVGQNLPLTPVPLPIGFVALSNQSMGALAGEIIQMKRDTAILVSASSTSGAPVPPAPIQPGSPGIPPPPTRPQSDLGNSQSGAVQPSSGRDYFLVMITGSKEPLIVDQQTNITIGDRKGRLQDLVEGARLQVSFETLADGTRHVTAIRASSEQKPKSDIVQPGQDNVVPPIGGTLGDAYHCQVLQRKTDAVFVKNNQNEIAVLMSANSVEPLRVDDRTRFIVNNQEARFSDLQVGMNTQVFLETYNQFRRVIGIMASKVISAQPR